MADTTSYEEELPRDAAATRVQELVGELQGAGPAKIQVGNKTVTLSPASVIEYSVDVEERSPMLGGHREQVTLTLEWKVEEE